MLAFTDFNNDFSFIINEISKISEFYTTENC